MTFHVAKVEPGSSLFSDTRAQTDICMLNQKKRKEMITFSVD